MGTGGEGGEKHFHRCTQGQVEKKTEILRKTETQKGERNVKGERERQRNQEGKKAKTWER